jgi:hypothetical protein
MNKIIKILFFFILTISPIATTFCCHDSMFVADATLDPLSKFQHQYENKYYGFAVSIPKGLFAETNPLPAIDRRCSILLS